MSDIINARISGKNRAGRYQIRFTEREGGVWHSRTISTGTGSKREAQTFLQDWLDAEMAAKLREQCPTIDDLADKYMRDAQQRGVGPSTRFSLKPILAFFGAKRPRELEIDTFEDYKTTRRKHVKDATIRRELVALTAVLNFGVKHRIIDQSEKPYISLPAQSQPRQDFLSEKEEKAYYQFALDYTPKGQPLHKITRLVCVAMDTAARRAAIENLTWDRVDLQNRLIDFREPNKTLSKKRRVSVPISDRLMPLLKRAYKERTDEYVTGAGSARRALETFQRKSPQPHIKMHNLRHTWATLAARRGVDLWKIAGVLGDDEKTVRDNYLHHHPDHLRGAFE